MKNIKLILFDLDDTLYDESTFVKSGFMAVSKYLETEFKHPFSDLYEEMLSIHKNEGRDLVFDKLLKRKKITPTKSLTEKLINIYRYHDSVNIAPFTGVVSLLSYLNNAGFKNILVTDTNYKVQKHKVKNLGLQKYFHTLYFTDEHGYKKPDPRIYGEIFTNLGVDGNQALIVGDDPNCDFVRANELGCTTVRLKQGRLKNLKKDKRHEANYEFNSWKKFDDWIRSNFDYNQNSNDKITKNANR